MKPLYRKVLKQALFITWRAKFLWIFGFFAALLGNGGAYEILFRSFSQAREKGILAIILDTLSESGLLQSLTFQNLKESFLAEPFALFILLWLILIGIALFIFIVWFVVVSQGALTSSAKKIARGEETNFKEAALKGIKFFWPILGLDVIAQAILCLILLGMRTPLVIVKATSVWNWILIFALFSLFAVIGIIIFFVTQYAICFVVLKGKKMLKSVREAVSLFLKNWIISLEMALILLAINILVAIGTFLLAIFSSLPLLLLGLIFYFLSFPVGIWFIICLILLIFLLFLVLLGAILATFQYSSWVLLFLRLTEEGGVSKIVRLVKGIRKKIGGKGEDKEEEIK